MMNILWEKYLNLYKNCMVYTKQYNKRLSTLIVVSVFTKILSLIPPFFNGKIIDNVIMQNFNNIIILVLCIALTSILIGAFSLLQTYININLSNDILVYLKENLIKKILKLKMSAFDKMTSGSYIERIEHDINEVKSFYIDTVPELIISIMSMIVSGAFAFYLSPVLTIVGFISFPISSAIYYYFGKKVKKSYVFLRKATDEYISILQQSINSERAIKGLHIEQAIFNKIKLKIKELYQLSIKNGMLSAYGGLVQLLSATIIEILLMSLACYFIIKGEITIGSYVSFNIYLSTFLSALKTIASTNLNIQTVSVTMERLNQITYNNDVEDIDNCKIVINDGNVNIQHLYFSYNENKKILNDLCIDFKSNNLHAIVGTSGCGKTTLFNLLLRIYDCEENTVFIDNKDTTTLALSDLRNAISYVQQDPFVFNDTIRENLCIINPKATDDEIIDACKKANIYDTIKSLPKGLDTIIGEKGFNFSGGQKQRLAIARGILKNAKLYLFDEITSELDGEIEKDILKVLLELAKKHTVIIIAHRLTTVVNIPRIVVIDEGKKVAEGSHEQLLDSCKLYRRLFKL